MRGFRRYFCDGRVEYFHFFLKDFDSFVELEIFRGCLFGGLLSDLEFPV
jgi:hypothetical protein